MTGRRRLITIGSTLLVLLCGCADVWAQGVARKVAMDLEKIETYRGRVVERGLVEGETVVRDVSYRRPWHVRTEVVSPAEHAGELFLYDGERVVMWWPQAEFGIEIRGIANPTTAEVRSHIQRLTRANLDAYTFSLRSENRRVAGQRASEWQILPARRGPFRLRHRSWNHARYAMPLKMEFDDQAGQLWYGMEFESIDFDAHVAAAEFEFHFPDNAVVFRWDLSAPGVTLAQAQRTMNFPVLVPRVLPRGHSIRKIVVPQHCLPMLAMVMDRGATRLSLTQTRYLGTVTEPLGKPIAVGDETGYLAFMGGFATVTWVRGKTALTLTGNLPFPELIAVAASVELPDAADAADASDAAE